MLAAASAACRTSTSRSIAPVALRTLARNHSTATTIPATPLASSFYSDPTQFSQGGEAVRGTPSHLSSEERHTLEGMLRVDHAGEVAANTIYEAQANVFALLGDVRTKKLMLDMWDVEKKHLGVAQQLLDQHHTRPSALLPLWGLAGSVLGAGTAILGRKAAMACTEAVETVIGEHYDDQLEHLRKITGVKADPIADRVGKRLVPSKQQLKRQSRRMPKRKRTNRLRYSRR